MIVVLLGAPGAGKGTQADLVRERLGFRKISTGDALRKHVSEATKIGQTAKRFMDQGLLVPDEVLLEILEAEIGSNASEKILLDGYPRNVEQAKALSRLDTPHGVQSVIYLNVDTDSLVERLSGRRVCKGCGKSYHVKFGMPKTQDGSCDVCGGVLEQRVDDRPEKIRTRLGVFASETQPVVDFYRNGGKLRQVEGDKRPEEVFSTITECLEATSSM